MTGPIVLLDQVNDDPDFIWDALNPESKVNVLEQCIKKDPHSTESRGLKWSCLYVETYAKRRHILNAIDHWWSILIRHPDVQPTELHNLAGQLHEEVWERSRYGRSIGEVYAEMDDPEANNTLTDGRISPIVAEWVFERFAIERRNLDRTPSW